MKTTDPRDPLDQRIDRLLSGKPLRPSADFADRVVAEAEARGLRPDEPASRRRRLLRFSLPLAAALVLSFAAIQVFFKPTPATPAATLSTAEIQEILLLEESLSGLANFSPGDLDSPELEPTLDSITFGFES